MAFCVEFEEPCHMEIKRRLVKENVLAVTDSLPELGGVAGFSTHVGWTDGQLWVEVRTELSNCFRLMNNVWLGLFLFSGTWQMSCNMGFFLSYHNHLFHFCKCICNDASENFKLMYRWNMGGFSLLSETCFLTLGWVSQIYFIFWVYPQSRLAFFNLALSVQILSATLLATS